ncbi:MAG: SDR family oxidoreductase [Gemmatimonadetes bacterium]|nr:SDR family oxidoreductase [Gemmatimonadota bacterium]
MPAAVVTGASSGIGLELARLFAADRYDLFLVARNETALRHLAEDLSGRHGIRVWPVVADLSRPEGPAAVAAAVASAGSEMTALINNAGFGLLGRFVDTPLERDLEMIQVNVSALTDLTRRFLPGMVARRRGMILNVASTAGFQPGPLMSVYYATKAYVVSFSLALSVELEGTGVTSTVLCPGPTRTAFHAAAGMKGTRMERLAMEAEPVARAGYHAMLRGRKMVTPGTLNKLLAVGTRAVPRTWAARVAKRRQEKRNK